MNDPVFLYNTSTRSKEEFTTLKPGVVSMYCCGPTVYNYAHIGNLRTYVSEDFLRRTLEFAGYHVRHVVNITDVGHLTSDEDTGEDKMEKGAEREGKTVWQIAQHYTDAFKKDWARLKLEEPEIWPKATEHIEDQIKLVKTLEEKGFAYETTDGIYFDTSQFSRYGEFAGLDLDGLQAGARIEMVEGKKSPTDFALWKFSPEGRQRQMEWDSPWGKGFPGWHVECSAMSMKHLGDTLDIHCGGTDHIRVHHTNEIAQSECCTGKTFARYWFHGEFLRLQKDGEGIAKMSKSLGNFVTLSSLMESGFTPMDYRYFCMTAHYRNFLTFSWESLASARSSLKGLRKKVEPLIDKAVSPDSAIADRWQKNFRDVLFDDLNVPQALATLYQMLKDEDLPEGEKAGLVREFDQVFGLGLMDSSNAKTESITREKNLGPELEKLLEERKQARKKKDFARSDEIRDLFKHKGIVLQDNPDGTTSLIKTS